MMIEASPSTAPELETEELLKLISESDSLVPGSVQTVVPKWKSNKLASLGVGYNKLVSLAGPTGVVRLSEVEKPRLDVRGNPVMKIGSTTRQSTTVNAVATASSTVNLKDLALGTLEPQELTDLSSEELLALSNQLSDERDQQLGDLVIIGQMCNHNVEFLVDTGACISAISTRLWSRIRRIRRDEKPPTLLPYKGTVTSHK